MNEFGAKLNGASNMFDPKIKKSQMNSYIAWTNDAITDQKIRIVVDGFPRSGTNFVRNVCLAMTSNDIVYNDAAFHFLDNYKITDGYLHNKNVIHIFPIRNSIYDVIVSNLILRDVINKNKFFANNAINIILNRIEKCIKQAIDGFKNIYFIRIDNLVNDQSQLLDIFKKYNIPYDKTFDIDTMIADGIKEDILMKNIRHNRYPIDVYEKNDRIRIAKSMLENKKFNNKLENIYQLYDKLLYKIVQ